jgi:AcrR family transcriptional regulator
MLEKGYALAAMAGAFQPVNTAEYTDPRVLRSRQLLMESLLRLLGRKEFDEISIQEIADEATLNRATFYLQLPRQECPAAGHDSRSLL